MNRKPSPVIRIAALLLAMLILLPSLFACKKEQEQLPEGKPRLTVDDQGKITYLVKLSAKDQQANAGKTAYLYELLPGETVSDLNGKSPMLQNNVSVRIRFVFSMTDDNGNDRRCNRYVMVFSDGSVFGSPVSLSNPELLATNTDPFPNANGIKGMQGGNEALGRILNSTHSLVSLSSSELTSGTSPLSWNGEEFAMKQSVLDTADQQVNAAIREDMQVTLELTLDSELPILRSTALINLLLHRYEGKVTGLIIRETNPQKSDGDTYPSSVKKMVSILCTAHTAMVSRAKNGRVYLGIDEQMNHTLTYLQDVLSAVKETLPNAIGAALYPTPSTASIAQNAENADGQADRDLLLSDLIGATEAIRESVGKNTSVCVAGLCIPAANGALQSALYAYAYRASQGIKADFLIYKTPVHAETGLYDADGFPRSAAECFALADTAENLVAETLAAELLGKDWTSLKAPRVARIALTEKGYANTADNAGKLYFDFSKDSDQPQFEAIGNATSPSTVRSESWNANVLTTKITPAPMGVNSGIRTKITDTKKLHKAQVLSANLHLQSNGAEKAEVTMLLEGTATDGKSVSLKATITLNCNEWQTVSFPISGFTTLMDPNVPCSLSLTMTPIESETQDENVGDHHALLLHSVSLRGAATDYSGLIFIGVIAGGFLIGFSVIILFSIRKKRRYNG